MLFNLIVSRFLFELFYSHVLYSNFICFYFHYYFTDIMSWTEKDNLF